MDEDDFSTTTSLRGTSLEVGIDSLDREHAELFRLIRDLTDNAETSQRQWARLVEEAADRHRDHFRGEEALFETLQIAWLEQHRRAHHDLQMMIDAIARADDPATRHLVTLGCKDQLFRHIVIEDMRYKWAFYDLGRSDYDVRSFDRRFPDRAIVKSSTD